MKHGTVHAALAIATLFAMGSAAGQDQAADYRKLGNALIPKIEELAQWCKDAGLGAERQRLLDGILTIDPDHKKTREALAYKKLNDGAFGQFQTRLEQVRQDPRRTQKANRRTVRRLRRRSRQFGQDRHQGRRVCRS